MTRFRCDQVTHRTYFPLYPLLPHQWTEKTSCWLLYFSQLRPISMTTSDGLSQLAQNPAYGASNVLEWIKIDKFNDYLIYKRRQARRQTSTWLLRRGSPPNRSPPCPCAGAARPPLKVTVNYLNSIRGLSDPEDIANWNNFCSTNENKKLRDWHINKVQYPWLLPGYNESLSSFPKGFWQQSPSHTNLVESAHVASNKGTKINLLPVESVRKARIFDAEKAASVAAAREACILVNRHNQDQVRMARNVTRTAKRKSYRQEHGNVELKSQKKELGRVPCHSTASRTGSSTSIPKLVGTRSDDSDDALDETDIEYGSGSYDGSFGVDLPMNDLGGSPLWTITDEVLDAAFNSNNPEPMVDAGGFEQQWQAAVNMGFDQELQAILDAVQFSAPADDWPTLPPALPLSPPPESTSSRADSPVPTPVAPEPAPAPRKRQREEVDLRNVLDQPRARKVRKREW
ncbi:hypothetical protein C8J57DRAFT_1613955 [Mycena rebaudengoi]|nr:hypothetical protein C8J57DRAFT_1613955 [Mycena rebaudengoi]